MKKSYRARNAHISSPEISSVDRILYLQRAIGNQTVQRLIKSGVLQAKLGQPVDKYEQEADRAADIVMRMPEHRVVTYGGELNVQRLCRQLYLSGTGCKKVLQRQVSPQQPPPAAAQPAPSQLAIACQNQQVTPRGTGGNNESAITVTGASPNANLRFTVQPLQSSGHAHHVQSRPVGRVRPARVTANRNGRASANYTSGIVAGTERITATQQSQTPQQAECDIDIHVQGLTPLAATGLGYDLVGATPAHPDNHYALPATNNALQLIAADFAFVPYHAIPIIQQSINALQQPGQQQPQSGRPLTNQQMANLLPNPVARNFLRLTLNQLQQLEAALNNWPLLGYNDLSLKHGGIFDINGDWAPPHKTHRIGNTLDFRISNLNELHRRIVRRIITKYGADILNEGNHWHLTF